MNGNVAPRLVDRVSVIAWDTWRNVSAEDPYLARQNTHPHVPDLWTSARRPSASWGCRRVTASSAAAVHPPPGRSQPTFSVRMHT
eukprot:311822-Chlamydomonas_euryale.AAC.3